VSDSDDLAAARGCAWGLSLGAIAWGLVVVGILIIRACGANF
jgi:hypothetical protein